MRFRTRLAIVTTHPIQYYAPLYRELASAKQLHVKVFYTWSQAAEGAIYDPEFRATREWDVPLLTGYDFEFVPNVARKPGSGHFTGVVNPTLIDAITAWGADAIYIQAWNLQSHLNAARYFHGRLPVFFRGDSTILEPMPPLRRALRRTWLSWVYRHIDVALAVGTHSRDYFLWSGVPASNIEVVPHAIDTRRFGDPTGAADSHALEWRRSLDIDDGDRVVLYAGKFAPVKDPLLLLDAFRDVAAARSRLVFVGSGELESQLRERVGDDPRVTILPFQNQRAMPAVYRLGDIFVLPSRGPETWGLALNEALTSGRPVIASSRVGGARDLIVDGMNGWEFAARSRDSLAGTLRAALALPRANLHAMGRRGQAGADRWSAQTVAARIADIVSARVAGAKHAA